MKTNYKFFLTAITLLIGSFIFAQKGMNVGRIKSQHYFEEIPFELIEGLPIVKVQFKGKVRKFMFDTGAQNLYFENINDAKNTKNAKIQDSNQKMGDAKIVYGQEFSIGSVKFNDQAFVVTSPTDNFLKNCYGIDGLIGSNAIRNSIVKLDYSRKVLVITNDISKIDLNNYKSFKLEKTGNSTTYPYIKVTFVAKKQVNIFYLIDTGSTGSLDLTTNAYNSLLKNQAITESQKGIGISQLGFFGANYDDNLLRVKTVTAKIGELSHNNSFLRVSEGQDSKVGFLILRLLNPVFDLGNNRIYLQTPQKPSTLNDRDVSIIYKEGKTVISALWGDNITKAKIGDEVLEIDGKNPNITSLCDIIIDNPLKDAKILTLRNSEGKIYTISK